MKRTLYEKIVPLLLVFICFHNPIISQNTEELFSLSGLRFGIDVTDDIGSLSDNSLFYRGDTIYEDTNI